MNSNRVFMCVALLLGVLIGGLVPVLSAQTTPRVIRYHQFCQEFTGFNILPEMNASADRRGRAGYIITGHTYHPGGTGSLCFSRELP